MKHTVAEHADCFKRFKPVISVTVEVIYLQAIPPVICSDVAAIDAPLIAAKHLRADALPSGRLGLACELALRAPLCRIQIGRRQRLEGS